MDLDLLLRTFVALFATMNVLAVLPLVVAMLGELPPGPRRAASRRALAVGTALAAVLAVAGRWIFGLLAITVVDLRIAGGLVLLVFAVHDLLFSTAQRKEPAAAPDDEVGIVPLGIPILVGPAGMTAVLVTADSAGSLTTLMALTVVTAVNAALLEGAPRVLAAVGPSATRAFGKVMSLFLAAIAVSMIRTGVATLP
ncbi:MAG: MarC family protein [Alphaproteobacteria bacterium]|nr:MarC family protein [Alphaproteobacteria bacterium]